MLTSSRARRRKGLAWLDEGALAVERRKMNFLSWFSLLSQVLPLVVQLVKDVEQPGQGPLKKEAVIALALAALDASLQLTGKPPLTDSQKGFLVFFISIAIDNLVSLFNKTGQFQKA
jgi:hypothetical protein